MVAAKVTIIKSQEKLVRAIIKKKSLSIRIDFLDHGRVL